MALWIDTDAVKDFLGDDGPATDDGLALALEAAVVYVETVAASVSARPELWVGDSPAVFTPDPLVKLGTAMLAARWYARRSSLTGTTGGYGEFGTGQILRYDPDIARMLRIGTFAPFTFGAPSLPVTETPVV